MQSDTNNPEMTSFFVIRNNQNMMGKLPYGDCGDKSIYITIFNFFETLNMIHIYMCILCPFKKKIFKILLI